MAELHRVATEGRAAECTGCMITGSSLGSGGGGSERFVDGPSSTTRWYFGFPTVESVGAILHDLCKRCSGWVRWRWRCRNVLNPITCSQVEGALSEGHQASL